MNIPIIQSGIKQVIVVREDILRVRRGKIWAQAAHAGREFLLDYFRWKATGDSFNITPEMWDWIFGSRTTVALTCEEESDLDILHQQSEDAGIYSSLITDLGLTCFDRPTKTCIAIGPDLVDKIDKITRFGTVRTKLA